MQTLIEKIQASFTSAADAAEAEQNIALCKSLGLVSDWSAVPAKERDFARLVLAVKKHLPPGGTIETGVYRGGTSGLLLLSCAPETFHVTIDPYGLPTQSYTMPEYVEWPTARATQSTLHQLAASRQVTYCHYLMDSQTFVRSDLLQHQGHFSMVHLDGDHSYAAFAAELLYFKRKLAGPTVFIMDDHDDHFPDVEQVLQRYAHDMTRLLHNVYDFPNYGKAGFSAWFYAGHNPTR
jgi:hypothetical protein